MVKTTVALEAELLDRARIAAIVHKSSLQKLVGEGLEIRLKQLDKKGRD